MTDFTTSAEDSMERKKKLMGREMQSSVTECFPVNVFLPAEDLSCYHCKSSFFVFP